MSWIRSTLFVLLEINFGHWIVSRTMLLSCTSCKFYLEGYFESHTCASTKNQLTASYSSYTSSLKALRKVWIFIMWIWIWTFSEQKNRKYVHQEKSMSSNLFIIYFLPSKVVDLSLRLWNATIFRKHREVILPIGRHYVPVFIFIFIYVLG